MNDTLFQQARLAKVRALKVSRLARKPALWPAVRRGVVPSVEHATVPFRGSYGTVFDVGASRGQFALFARSRFPTAKVVCFEPLPDSRVALEAVLGGQVEVRPVAVGATPGTAELQVSAQDDSSSLLPIGSRQVAEYPGTQRAGTLEVPVVALVDEILETSLGPRLLKIDVQGLELEVLKGAGNGLDLIDDAFVECSFVELYEGQALADEVVAFMLGHGLRLAGLYGITYAADGSAVQADFLFRRDQGAES